MSTTGFGARLAAATATHGPLCVGIDPHASLLAAWGLPDDVAGLERFARTAAEALAPVCAVVKPQAAFFERHGAAGVAVLERTLADLRAGGTLSLLDVKRGDIGSTSQAYADAYLDPASPLAADAITVSPYLGFGSLDPFVATARHHGGGLFVLALTSNPEGPQVQHARTASGATVAAEVLEALRALNAPERAVGALGSFGAVVGATITPGGHDLGIDGPLLAPGFGAQGGTVADLHRVFGAAYPQVLPSSSREVLSRGPDVAALREAVTALQEQLRG
ncbi:orotidine-5'-phosphate decarboxylase [Nocardioides sp.]|uniref:orotidine-5'-phosphate decarboxylase n=1 Tax=Nocardioides sp. TaxID=35761 RepID=UPI00351764A8